MPTASHYDSAQLLTHLRTSALDPGSLPKLELDELMRESYKCLTRHNEDATAPDLFHWYCDQAAPVVKESAIFLIRLHAYNGPHVPIWKSMCLQVISSCCDCSYAYQCAKPLCRTSYLSDYAPATLDKFFEAIDKWELHDVTEICIQRIHSKDSTELKTPIPFPIAYRILCSPYLLQDAPLMDFLTTRSISNASGLQPTQPPCAFPLLALDSRPHIREWFETSRSHFPYFTKFDGPVSIIFGEVLVTLSGNAGPTGEPKPTSLLETSTRGASLWDLLPNAFQLFCLPAILELFNSRRKQFPRLLLSHLSDRTNFQGVLRCFLQVIAILRESLWFEDAPELPGVVLDSIKDNQAMPHALQDGRNAEHNWALDWILPYLQSLWSSKAFSSSFAKIFIYLGEELQHAIYSDRVHVYAFETLFQVLLTLHGRATEESNAVQQLTMLRLCETHSAVITAVALGSQYQSPAWNNPRQTAQTVLKRLLMRDAEAALQCLSELCRARRDLSRIFISRSAAPSVSSVEACSPLPQGVMIHTQLWESVYGRLHPNHADGIALVLPAVTRVAHVDRLRIGPDEAFSSSFLKTDQALRSRFVRCTHNVWGALGTIRDSFGPSLESFAELAGVDSLVKFLSKEGVTEDAIQLMLCPIDSLNGAAKALGLNAYDAVERSACYKAFLENHPTASFKGLISYLTTFNHYASAMPEACGTSKYVVRSMTDILSCLGDAASGLLLDDDYGDSENLPLFAYVPKLWRRMTDGLSIIFRLVKSWSIFYPYEEMVVWMRDALIFGRDMIAVVEVLQTATNRAGARLASSSDAETPNLIADLCVILLELIEWLKLTDEETLHQSHQLLKSLFAFFALSKTNPPRSAVTLLERYAMRAKGTKTQLDDSKLAELMAVMEPFLDQDVTIIQPPKLRSTPKTPASTSNDDDDIEYLGTSSGPAERKESQRVVPESLRTESTSRDDSRSRLRMSAVVIPPSTLGAKGVMSNFVTKLAAPKTSKISKGRPSYKPIEVERPSEIAIQNYRKAQQAGKESIPSNGILAGPSITPSVPSKIESKLRAPAPEVVSSSSEATSSEDENGADELRTKIPSPKIAKVERRQIKVVNQSIRQTVDQEALRKEEARRTELRLKPDLSAFYRHVLEWDYDSAGSEPPDVQPQFSKIPDSFPPGNAMEVYSKVFEPLILLETWSQLIKTKEEIPTTFEAEVTARGRTDKWLDLEVSISEAISPGWYVTENDIVLLREADGPKSILCKVKKSKLARESLSIGLRCSPFTNALASVDSLLMIRSRWKLTRLMSLSTVYREYAALRGLQYYDLFEDIVHPKRGVLPKASPERVKECMSRHQVNEPQANAIVGSLQIRGFSLIQGPPGTGKTSTIVALAYTFLLNRRRPATAIFVGRESRSEDKEPPKKLLICAPSNAAIDEVAQRLKQGFRKSDGSLYIPKIVRIGAEEKMNPSIKDISLNVLVAAKMGAEPTTTDLTALRGSLKEIGNKIRVKLEELESLKDNPSRTSDLQRELHELKSERTKLGRNLDAAKDANTNISRARDSNIRKFEAQILHEADVICSTLSSSGHASLAPYLFETVIIDEAAQSIELSSLIPLKYRCTQCILVGDPMQLPPTVLSPLAARHMYNQSLFVRLNRHKPAYLLSIQYRMHPEISVLPRNLFYEGRLKDGPDMAAKRLTPWHSDSLFRPYQFFDVADGREEMAKGHSLLNRTEVKFAVSLYERLRNVFSSRVDLDQRVGIIAMYDAQKNELQRQFSAKFSRSILSSIDFGTVDGFQGQEKDIIIVSCVRAGPNVQRIGHLVDIRRMNVAMTRARCSLFILGHAATLERSNDMWAKIVQDARERSCFTNSAQIGGVTRNLQASWRPQPKVAKARISPKKIATIQTLPLRRPSDMSQPNAASGASPQNVPASQSESSTVSSIPSKRQAPDDAQESRNLNPQSMGQSNGKRQKPGPSLFIPKKVNEILS
ncbi:SEN1 N terminal-domain-containing protein [Cantharellus anzutake]|uniref:SEN1 N terminal-domain-containing protein n=1 Tax=Cantharellus anzutake TaxID=1750568 RepID=UPI00190904AD|nr:SEN1 N terminal-domain-containing protein [Cantharellus anzutake]KAF8327025.1 SEN1 N terminal-domain-containing protein [Cantharellus anzutake]